MLGKLEKYHIAIECNPSSNYKIGEIGGNIFQEGFAAQVYLGAGGRLCP